MISEQISERHPIGSSQRQGFKTVTVQPPANSLTRGGMASAETAHSSLLLPRITITGEPSCCNSEQALFRFFCEIDDAAMSADLVMLATYPRGVKTSKGAHGLEQYADST